MHTTLLQHPTLLEHTISPWQLVHDAAHNIQDLFMKLKETMPSPTYLLHPSVTRALELSCNILTLSLHLSAGRADKPRLIDSLLFLFRAASSYKCIAARLAAVQRTLRMLGHAVLINDVAAHLNSESSHMPLPMPPMLPSTPQSLSHATLANNMAFQLNSEPSRMPMLMSTPMHQPVARRTRPRPGPIMLPSRQAFPGVALSTASTVPMQQAGSATVSMFEPSAMQRWEDEFLVPMPGRGHNVPGGFTS